nr:MAG: hypothetical protein [Bacteriophage sp.]
MEYYEPLTPELRQEINETIEKELGKLNTCKPTAFVAARRIGLRTTKNLIDSLPDGYPVPIARE